ncbi:MAG TPA: hypothetical protein DCG04_05440, partial [Rhodospirillaceae bacterium]|nr:hypothetical protein [Rhodospirillaceae bacterium]
KPAIPFRTPPGIRMVRIDAETGKLASPSSSKVIQEAFKAGTEPGANSDGVIITGNGAPILPIVQTGEPGVQDGGDSEPASSIGNNGFIPMPTNNAPTGDNPNSPAAPSGIY